MTEQTERASTAESNSAVWQERGILARLGLVSLLLMALLGAIRWASDVTNANAKRVSHNLVQMQSGMEAQAFQESSGLPPKKNRRQKK